MVKILVAGDVEGRYAETFARVAKLDVARGARFEARAFWMPRDAASRGARDARVPTPQKPAETALARPGSGPGRRLARSDATRVRSPSE